MYAKLPINSLNVMLTYDRRNFQSWLNVICKIRKFYNVSHFWNIFIKMSDSTEICMDVTLSCDGHGTISIVDWMWKEGRKWLLVAVSFPRSEDNPDHEIRESCSLWASWATEELNEATRTFGVISHDLTKGAQIQFLCQLSNARMLH